MIGLEEKLGIFMRKKLLLGISSHREEANTAT
jgi:hypothetical protein